MAALFGFKSRLSDNLFGEVTQPLVVGACIKHWCQVEINIIGAVPEILNIFTEQIKHFIIYSTRKLSF